MGDVENPLGLVVRQLSDKNYAQSLARYRFWFSIFQTYHQPPPDQVFDSIWKNRVGSITPASGQIIHSTIYLILRFATDAESDHILAPHSSGLRSHLCASSLREFFSNGLAAARYRKNSYGDGGPTREFCADVNLIAHWANLGYVEEAAIRDHILQSLISLPELYDHQADAIIVLFKLAGATFGAYADPSVVDRCFELLKHHYDNFPVKMWLVQVHTACVAKGGHRAKASFQEVFALRERGWEGLPPPPVLTTGKLKPSGANQKGPTVTFIATSLGLPNRDLEPQIPWPPPLELVTAPGADTAPASPITQSPPTSIATLSDFMIVDTSDDESPINPTAAAPHETFYLEDGNVEVLCGNTLFRVHTTILSFHSPALRRMFTQTRLATAESPNGCPRIVSSDPAKDFATLLKTIYLPGFVAPPACC